MNDKLLSLPWEIQVALGSGYAAYLISYIGIRGHHSGVDATFRAIAFGLIATAVLWLFPPQYQVARMGAAFLATVACGLLWRRFGMEMWCAFLRWANVSWADDIPSAWATVTSMNRRAFVTQVSVELEDGSWLFCIEAGRFNDAPFGPCVLGPNGDVALYVTHEQRSLDREIEELSDVRDPHYGDRLTYIPAARVRRVSFRHVLPNGSVRVEAEPATAEAAGT